MNVQEFVQQTIEEITLDVHEAQKTCKERAQVGATRKRHGTDSPGGSHREIEFDIAVIVTQSSKAGAGGSISVFGVGFGGGKEKDAHSSTTHRVKFAVPVVYL